MSNEREPVCVRVDGQSDPSASTAPATTATHRLPRDRPGRALTVPQAAETTKPQPRAPAPGPLPGRPPLAPRRPRRHRGSLTKGARRVGALQAQGTSATAAHGARADSGQSSSVLH